MKFSSQIIAAGSGSIGGCTFSRNRFGQYVRRRAVPVNPGSTQQTIMTAQLTALVARWKIITQSQRDGWTNYALNTPRTDALGNTIILTGQQMFIACNAPRIQAGFTIIDVQPVVFGVAILTPPTLTSLIASTGVLTYGFNNTDGWATATNGALLVYISRAQSPTTAFFKGPYRFTGQTNGATVPPTSPGTETSVFPYSPGQRAHVQFRAIQFDARISGLVRASILAS